MFYFLYTVFSLGYTDNIKIPYAKILGALTYPVYLVHQVFSYIFISALEDSLNKYLLLGITLISIFVVSYLIHIKIEKNMAEFLKTHLNNFITIKLEPTAKRLFSRSD
jgi:peptidoglycan/LPS O-acetylase OafA/YrhL